MSKIPSVGEIVHYVSYGTPGGEYTSQCRAAIVTEVEPDVSYEPIVVGLAVMNPEGFFFNRGVQHSDGAETPGSPDCPDAASHGTTHRYCSCGWMEAAYRGGTWHRLERA